VPIFCSPKTCVIPSTLDHTNYLAFSTWGLDLVGPFKKVKGGFTHVFVAVDKFTKWIKAKPAASITAAKAMEFNKEIMYRFGVPNNNITDNGTQFTAREFKDFCADSGINIITDNGTQFTAREWNSSRRSCTSLVYPTTLSPIMGFSSLQGSLKTFVQTRASRLIMPQCHTCRVMVKWSAETV
jgi:hypothetical protein